jgi:hypothetical protein
MVASQLNEIGATELFPLLNGLLVIEVATRWAQSKKSWALSILEKPLVTKNLVRLCAARGNKNGPWMQMGMTDRRREMPYR